MARQAVKVTVSANISHPDNHGPQVATSESGDVYVSYDDTKITGASQLFSALQSAFKLLINGHFRAGT